MTMSISTILKKLNSRDTKLIPHLPNLNKTIKFASILIAIVFLGFLGHQILATDNFTFDNTSGLSRFREKQAAIESGNNQESWMNEALISNAISLSQALGGTIPETVLKGEQTTWIPSGIIGVSNNAISYLYNPPASGIQYIAQTANSFIGKPAYAATGYEGLQGILPVWKSFRNATYIIFSIIFIAIGIAIMLRIKISQNAVITIQSAIPKLITSLILVTFSYAIAGLLIDFSYVIEALLLNIINVNNNLNVTKLVSDPSVWSLLFSLFPVTAVLSLSNIAGLITNLLGGSYQLGIIINILSVVGIGTMAIAILIILIFVTILTIKFLLGLAKCYISLILRIILGPLEIALGALPNSKIGFSSWLVNVIANLAVFPITIVFIVLLNMITASINSKNLWAPGVLAKLDTNGQFLSAIIGFAGFILISKLPKLIPEAIFNIKPSPFGKAIGEGFAPIGAFAGKTVKTGAGLGLGGLDSKVGRYQDADGNWHNNDLRGKVVSGANKFYQSWNKK